MTSDQEHFEDPEQRASIFHFLEKPEEVLEATYLLKSKKMAKESDRYLKIMGTTFENKTIKRF